MRSCVRFPPIADIGISWLVRICRPSRDRFDRRSTDPELGGAGFFEAIQKLPERVGVRASKVDTELALLDGQRVDDVAEVGSWPVAPIFRVEPSVEPGAEGKLRVERCVVLDDDIIPCELLDLKFGIAERRLDGIESEDPAGRKGDELRLAVIARKIGANQ